jgi:hypothetical protein
VCSGWAVSHELTEAASRQGFDARGFMINCEAVPRTSWMLLLSGSGRASLMSLWARQVRGDLPNRIKTVVVQASGVPGMDCRTGPGYGRGHVGVRSAPHAEMTGGSLAMAAW